MPAEKNMHGALGDVLAVAARYKSVIILTTIVVPIVALGVSMQQNKVYRATSEVLLENQDLGSALTGIQNTNGSTDPERYALTQAAIASVPAVAERAIKVSGLKNLTADELMKNSSVQPQVNADILQFTVDNASSADAATLATAYATAFTSYKLETDTASLREARKELEGRLASLKQQGEVNSQMYADVFKSVQDVRTLELLQSRASVVRPGTDVRQVQPRPVRSAALGAALGLLLGFGFAVLWNTLDKRIRNEDEVEESLGIPLLAKLPRYSKKIRGRDSLVMLGDPSHRAAESVRLLRTNLELAAIGNDAKTIMVTSAAPKEGKSTTISNLAVALARNGHRVALVDLDLREPSIARAFDLEGRPGVTDVTMERVALEEALVTIPLEAPSLARQASHAVSGGGSLDVLPAGTIPPNPGEFVGAQRLALVLKTIAHGHDFVLIDTPPILAVGDAVSLSTISDALFVVVRLDAIDRPTLRDMSRALGSCPCATLGFVLTNVEAKELYGTAHYGSDSRGSDDTRTPLRGVASTTR